MTDTKKGFTESQISNWRRYEAQRVDGSYNMFDPMAREATGLSKEDYLFCLKNYSELREAAEGRG